MRRVAIPALIVVSAQMMLACGGTATAPANASKPANTNAAAPAPANTNAAAPANTSAATKTSAGEVFTHENGGIQFEVPATWKSKADGDVMQITSPDESLFVMIWVPQDQSVDEALEGIGSEIDNYLANVKTAGEATSGQLSGMNIHSLNGTGTYEGQPVDFSLELVEAKKPVIILTITNKGAMAKHEADFTKFAQSIKRI
jgi:hypothetical protein